MVLLTVKGTKFADEFTFECSCKDLASTVAPKVAHIQNKRHSVKQQLGSWAELVPSARVAVTMEGRAEGDAALAPALEALLEKINAEMKNVRAAVPEGLYDSYWEQLRDMAVAIFPNECASPPQEEGAAAPAPAAEGEGEAAAPAGPHDAAIAALYQLYDNPEIDEEYRLMVYHCRCIMDPLWRVHELVAPEAVKAALAAAAATPSSTALVPSASAAVSSAAPGPSAPPAAAKSSSSSVALWFNGKEIDGSSLIGALCSNNEKSRITVKVALSGGAAPSLEPRLAYDDQRALRQAFMARAEERKGLEESELHAVLKRQYAGNAGAAIGAIAAAKVASATASGPPPSLKGGRITETVVSGAN